MDGGRALVEVGRDVAFELSLSQQDLFEYFLDIDDFEVVERSEHVGDGLLA